MKLCQPGADHFEEHYSEHEGRPFFAKLVEFASSGPVCAMVWEGDNIIATSRKIIGATNPQQAAIGTLRGDYGLCTGRNSVHGSDSVESADREIALWFDEEEVAIWEEHGEPQVYENTLGAENKRLEEQRSERDAAMVKAAEEALEAKAEAEPAKEEAKAAPAGEKEPKTPKGGNKKKNKKKK